jgi:Protein of unknown function (DUF2630)
MDDTEIMRRIKALVDQEHELLKLEEEGKLHGDQRDRAHSLEVSLDQCWDLLRQRRARRDAGLNPDDATPRDPNIVEHYQQ